MLYSKTNQENLNILYGFKCNYSCSGCITNSDIIDNNNDPELTDILSSIPKLANLFNVTNMVTLLGGEPFYYWDDRIVPIAQEVNRYFPDTLINIFTNGQLLGKSADKVFKLAEQIDNFSLTITNHLFNLYDTVPGKIWINNFEEFISNPNIVKISDVHYHIKNNIRANIYISTPSNWTHSYKITTNNQIKPFATNDPNGSAKYGCSAGIRCSMVYGKKLYKCSMLATLPTALKIKNQLDDPDWAKYLSYNPVEIDNPDARVLKEFVDTYGKPIDVCDMCSNNPQTSIASRTYNMIFTK